MPTTWSCQPHHQVVGKRKRAEASEFTGQNTLGHETLVFKGIYETVARVGFALQNVKKAGALVTFGRWGCAQDCHESSISQQHKRNWWDRSMIDCIIDSLIHSLIHCFIGSMIHFDSLIPRFNGSSLHWFVYFLSPLIHWFVASFVQWFIAWFIGWLIDSLLHSLPDSLISCFTDSFVHWFSGCLLQ